MALSMTGFGRGTYASEFFAVRVELRSVNHRYLEISIRLPRILGQFEDRLRRTINDHLGRGKIDVSIFFELLGAGEARVHLDKSLAGGYRQALLELAEACGIQADLRLDQFVRLPELFTIRPAELDEEVLWQGLQEAMRGALQELAAMRRLEGRRLLDDLDGRIVFLKGLTEQIETRAPVVPEAYRLLLQRRLAEILGQPGLDEARLAQEVAIYADRCNITEELVRLRSHLGQLRSTLGSEGALGRKADFIVQEINREVNTIGAKANDLTIAQVVIEYKSELEKIREQIQNLE